MKHAQWQRSKDARKLLDFAFNRVPQQLLVIASIACARTAEQYLDEGTRGPALNALTLAEAWVWGRVGPADVQAGAIVASRAARAANDDAASSATWSATDAAIAASDPHASASSSAYSASAAAEYTGQKGFNTTLADLAGLVRRIIPYPSTSRQNWPARWYDADRWVRGMLVEVPVVTAEEYVVFRVDGHVVEVITAREALGALGARMPMVPVAMDAAMESS